MTVDSLPTPASELSLDGEPIESPDAPLYTTPVPRTRQQRTYVCASTIGLYRRFHIVQSNFRWV